MSATEKSVWEVIRAHAGPYAPDAFLFVQEGLRGTVERMFDLGVEELDLEGDRHISGQQLCLGLRDFAVEQFGLLARTVLQSWNIYRTEDFGRIVYVLVESGLMRKADHDTFEDFAGVYDFDEAFGRDLEPAQTARAG